MDFEESRKIVLNLLQRQGKVKNSDMLQAMGGDAALFALVREDLIFNDLAEDKNNVGLVYLGPSAPHTGTPTGGAKAHSADSSKPGAHVPAGDIPKPILSTTNTVSSVPSFSEPTTRNVLPPRAGSISAAFSGTGEGIKAVKSPTLAKSEGTASRPKTAPFIPTTARPDISHPNKPVLPESSHANLALSFSRMRVELAQAKTQEKINAYLEAKFQEPEWMGLLAKKNAKGSALLNMIVKKSADNTLYIALALISLQAGYIDPAHPEAFPDNLAGLYQNYFDYAFTRQEFNQIRPTLTILTVAREPLSVEQIAAFVESEPVDTRAHLRALAMFFPEQNDLFQAYHPSVCEWLSGIENTHSSLRVNPRTGHQLIAEQLLARFTSGNYDRYTLAHLPYHLAGYQNWLELTQLLADFNFILARCTTGMLYNLIEAYTPLIPILIETKPADAKALFILQSVLQLAAPVLIQDSSQTTSQLVGRLQGFEHQENTPPLLATLIKSAQSWHGATWLRPISPVLTPPGGALLRSLSGHSAKITAAGLTSDGQRMVTASEDKTLRVWDLTRGTELACLQGHTQKIMAAALAQNGKIAVSASSDKLLKVWDISLHLQTNPATVTDPLTSDPRLLRNLGGHTYPVHCVAISPDGRLAVSGSADKLLKVWDLEKGREVRSLVGHTAGIEAVMITPDGRRVISASGDRTIRVWDISSGLQMQILHGQQSINTVLMITTDGHRIISSSFEDHTIKTWDIESGKLLQTLRGHNSFITGFAISPDKKLGISASGDWTLKVWDLQNGRELNTLKGHTAYVRTVLITPNGKWAISASGDKTIRVWDLQTGNQLHVFQGHAESVHHLFLTPDGRKLISISNDNAIKLWDLPTHIIPELKIEAPDRPPLYHADTVNAIALTPDGRRAVSVSRDATIKLWDLSNGMPLRTIPTRSSTINIVAITPGGQRVISAGDGIDVWDIERGAKLFSLDTTNMIFALAVTPDGKWVISGSHEHSLKVWELEGRRELGNMGTSHSHTSLVQSIAVTSDNRRIISGGLDKTLKLWDLQSGRELGTLRGHTEQVAAVAVTSDNKRILSASGDQTIKIWDLATGKELATLRGHAAGVRSIAVSPDGSKLVSASEDKTVKVWDLSNGQIIASYLADSKMCACCIAPDNKTIVSAGDSGWMHFLQLE